jgi:hypothetical protein
VKPLTGQAFSKFGSFGGLDDISTCHKIALLIKYSATQRGAAPFSDQNIVGLT